MVRTARRRPNEIVDPWPTGTTTDVAGRAAQAFVLELRRVIGEDSIRSIAALCGVNHETIRGILEGRVWPDMYTIAHLEAGLGVSLWQRHIPGSPGGRRARSRPRPLGF